MPSSFGLRLQTAFNTFGHLCVGLDPSPAILSDWGLPDNAQGLKDFGAAVIAACQGRVGIIKPQVAFFERHGSAGFAALEEIAELARQAQLLVIMDAKRGDIGSTMDGYADAWISKGAPFFSDALTLSPYLGFSSLMPTMSAARERGKGIFVLAATSNVEAKSLQTALKNNETIAESIWSGLNLANKAVDGSLLGSFGAVIGATVNPSDFAIDLRAESSTPILAPGFGAQGASLSQFSRLFGSAAERTIATVSRSVLSGGSLEISSLINKAVNELKGFNSTESEDE